jgi:hypothetical protein
MSACNKMKRIGYRYYDICKNIRLWINNNKNDDCKNNSKKSVIINILDRTLNDDIIDEYITNRTNCKNENHVFVEMRCFSKYDELYHVYNNYACMQAEKIVIEFGSVLDTFANSVINLKLSRASSILTPLIVDHYKERLNSIEILDPIFYPYSHHVFYGSIHNKIIDIRDNYGLIYLLHNTSLLDLYFGRECHNKKNNSLYDNLIKIKFSECHHLYLNYDVLISVLQMHSKVNCRHIDLK